MTNKILFYFKFNLSGTCKIQHNCTATLKATTCANGKIVVDACLTHYGHQKELQHTWLPKQKKEEIAALLQQGVGRNKILGDIREEGINAEEFKRYHLTDKKDLANITKAFGLGDVQKAKNDQDSVQAWINEWKENGNNPILYYKLQGEDVSDDFDLLKEDFIIVIQTPFQKAMAQKFSSKGVCIDSTHGTTGYDFLLTTLMVTDECGEGLPIAWCISNHEDFTHMCLFFTVLKENCGQLSPRWVMSDTASQFYNAWIAIMGGSPTRLLCTWHVDRAWREELRAKVKDNMVAADIYKMLRTVLQA